MRKEILTIENLDVKFKTHNGFIKAVNDLTLSIYENEKVVIIGESGSGKTALLSAICGLCFGSPGITNGRIFLNGESILHTQNNSKSNYNSKVNTFKINSNLRKKVRGEISYIFQDPKRSIDPLYPIYSHFQEALAGAKTKKEKYEEALKLVNSINIHNPELVLKKYPHELSGGMLQRIMILLAMIINPKILIADEPTTALDVISSSVTINFIKEFYKLNRSTVILVTHSLDIAESFADRIVVMKNGQLVEIVNVEDFFNKKNIHPYSEELLLSRIDPLLVNKYKSIYSINNTHIQNGFPGCKFINSCRYKSEKCKEPVKLRIISDNHSIRCIR
jgi:oligopeptide/dipeptide ABC transporter ATP-binding protein